MQQPPSMIHCSQPQSLPSQAHHGGDQLTHPSSFCKFESHACSVNGRPWWLGNYSGNLVNTIYYHHHTTKPYINICDLFLIVIQNLTFGNSIFYRHDKNLTFGNSIFYRHDKNLTFGNSIFYRHDKNLTFGNSNFYRHDKNLTFGNSNFYRHDKNLTPGKSNFYRHDKNLVFLGPIFIATIKIWYFWVQFLSWR